MNNSSPKVPEEPVNRTASVPYIVAFLSGKGGVGKSIISFNIAAEMAARGHRTLLVDGDWTFGNLHILGNAMPTAGLSEFVGGLELASAVQHIAENLDLLASPAAIGAGGEPRPQDIHRLVQLLPAAAADYDLILLDTSSGRLDIINRATACADLSLIVINPELTSISNGYGLLKYVVRTSGNINTGVLVNRAQSGTDSEYIYQKFAVLAERFLRSIPHYAGYLLEHELVSQSVAEQKPLVRLNRKAPAAVQISTLCEFLTGEWKTGAKSEPSSRSVNLKSETVLADI